MKFYPSIITKKIDKEGIEDCIELDVYRSDCNLYL